MAGLVGVALGVDVEVDDERVMVVHLRYFKRRERRECPRESQTAWQSINSQI